MITVANAPVSYGVFDLARPELVPPPGGGELLDAVAAAGYDAVDLGPRGLFGTGRALADALAEHGLLLCGAWIDLPLTGGDAEFDAALARALPVLEDLALLASIQDGPPPRPTLADAGDESRRARPGGGPGLEADGRAWAALVEHLECVCALARGLGLEPTFHHHAATYVETPAEIDRLLRDTSVGLTLDSGHLLLAGGDPLEGFDRWRGRINHIHLKDVDTSVLPRAGRGPDALRRLWEDRAFTALGDGDLDVAGLMDRIVAGGYDGYLVVEQDVVLLERGDVERAGADQVRNRETLRRWIP